MTILVNKVATDPDKAEVLGRGELQVTFSVIVYSVLAWGRVEACAPIEDFVLCAFFWLLCLACLFVLLLVCFLFVCFVLFCLVCLLQ